ncbi:MAG: ABC transporter ATP-binding protein [Variovorax sp.]
MSAATQQTFEPGATVLEARNLRIGFRGAPSIVDGIDLVLKAGRMSCLVGESGSGKSLTALSLLQLLPPDAVMSADLLRIADMRLSHEGAQAMKRLRGDRIAMVFQEPMSALNPVMTVGEQVAEPLMRHRGLGRSAAMAAVLEVFRQVRISAPEARLSAYPHQLSGGMRQRVMIAMALVCRPAVLVADEPTTALDVTTQSQILRLIDGLRDELGTAVLMITHNLAVVAEIADDIVVMYAGRVVERGSREQIFDNPLHPYTLALFAAMPRSEDRGRALAAIDGQVPSLGAMPPGCRFAPRCPFAVAQCTQASPPLAMHDPHEPGHFAACWRAPIEDTLT